MTGPRATEGGYDYMMQGLAGWMSLTGDPDGPPTKSGLSLVDLSGGYASAIAVLAGLWRARRDGVGCDCDVSLFETALHELMYVGTWAASRGYVPPRRRNSAHPSIVPFQNFETADGWIVVACPKEKFWELLCDADRATGARATEFPSFADRDRRRDELEPVLEEVFRGRTSEEWLAALAAAGVPSAPVNDVAAALAEARLVEYEHPRLGHGAPGRVAAPPLGRRSRRCGRRRRAGRTPSRCSSSCAATSRSACRSSRPPASSATRKEERMAREADPPASGVRARDLVGYGASPPDPQWPDGARLAVSFVLNYEEGGERSLLEGDPESESYLQEVVGAPPTVGRRNLNAESMFEFGSRAGFWRVHRIFTAHGLPLTVYAVGRALEQNPDAARAMVDAGWEVASHGWRWFDYLDMPEDEEREHMRRAIVAIEQACGQRPVGWYTGRNSENTRRLVVEEGGFLYDSDSYADELPYWVDVDGHDHLVIPYTLDANDMKFLITNGFQTVEPVPRVPRGLVRPAPRGGWPDDVGRPPLPDRRQARPRGGAGPVPGARQGTSGRVGDHACRDRSALAEGSTPGVRYSIRVGVRVRLVPWLEKAVSDSCGRPQEGGVVSDVVSTPEGRLRSAVGRRDKMEDSPDLRSAAVRRGRRT